MEGKYSFFLCRAMLILVDPTEYFHRVYTYLLMTARLKFEETLLWFVYLKYR